MDGVRSGARKYWALALCAAAVFLGLNTLPAAAQNAPLVLSEHRVTSDAAGVRSRARTAAFPDGRHIVVWRDSELFGKGGDGIGDLCDPCTNTGGQTIDIKPQLSMKFVGENLTYGDDRVKAKG